MRDTHEAMAEAIAWLERVLQLIDTSGIGVMAAPHIDHGLHLLRIESAGSPSVRPAVL